MISGAVREFIHRRLGVGSHAVRGLDEPPFGIIATASDEDVSYDYPCFLSDAGNRADGASWGGDGPRSANWRLRRIDCNLLRALVTSVQEPTIPSCVA